MTSKAANILYLQDPEYVERSCNKTWTFSPGRYEITKGRLTGTIINKGKVRTATTLIIPVSI